MSFTPVETTLPTHAYSERHLQTQTTIIPGDLARLNKDLAAFVKSKQLFGNESSNLLNHSYSTVKPEISILSSPPPSRPFIIPPLLIQKESIEGWGEMFKYIEADIPENSIYRKLLACIPIFGFIPAVLNECSLEKKIMQGKDAKYLIRLIDIKNDYKTCSIIRELLSLAIIVNAVAFGVLCLPVGAGIGLIAICCKVFYIYGMHKNNQIINMLQKDDASVKAAIQQMPTALW